MHIRWVDRGRAVETLRAGLTAEVTGAWKIPPLCGKPDQWSALDAGAAEDVITELYDMISREKIWLAVEPVTRVRGLPLSFYPGSVLYEAETRTLDGHDALVTFIKTPSRLLLLTGAATTLHSINGQEGIDLQTADLARRYAEFFCEAVVAEAGPFTVADHPSLRLDRPLTKSESYTLSYARAAMEAPIYHEEDAEWRWATAVLHGAHLFKNNFRLTKDGVIVMAGDELVLQEPLPFKIWAFWSGVRQDRTAACLQAAEASDD